jgi:serine protease Do
MSRIRWYGPTIVLCLTLLGVLLAGPAVARKLVWAQTDASVDQSRQQLKNNQTLKNLSDSFRKVSKAVEPSVVHIKILSRQEQAQQRMPDDLLERFFGPRFEERFDQERPNGQGDEPMEQYNAPQVEGNGSGWVYDKQGHIITNHHVVANADEIRVRFFDGTEREAEVVGTDPQTDVAVLKVDHDELHPATVADQSNPVQQGEMVFAFGSPFRFEFSMSQGIVSAKGRQLGIIRSYDEDTGQVTAGYENFIQTDAAINPGNSGGPLTNIYGDVIGMNTAIASRTGSYNGIGFAIPVNMVTDVVDQLISKGEVSRGYLGVYIDDLDKQMAETFDFGSEDGVLVVNPIDGSPAEAAGLQAGDIITHLKTKSMDQKRSVANADELRMTVASLEPGTEVALTVFRKGDTVEKTVTLGRLSDKQASAEGGGQPSPSGEADESAQGAQILRKLGVESVATFNEQIAQQLGIDYQPGAVVRAVRPNSVADAQGLQRGMIITQVMDQSISSAKDLVEAVEQRGSDKPIRLRVLQWNPQRDSFLSRFVVLTLPEGAQR